MRDRTPSTSQHRSVQHRSVLLAMALFTALTGAALAQEPSSGAVRIDTAKDDFTKDIVALSSSTFAVRDAAYRRLAAAGDSAVAALEEAASTNDLEVSTRCIQLLGRAVRDRNNQRAVAALNRLAEGADGVARSAQQAIVELEASPADQAAAILEAEGVRLSHGRDGDVRLANVTNDRHAELVSEIRTLQSLGLRGQEVTDAGLRAIATLPNLESVSIRRTSVTGAGLRVLCDLESLDSITLDAEQLAGHELRVLKDAKQLRCLELSAPDHLDLAFLIDLPQLSTLFLSGAYLDVDRVTKLNRLSHLRSLYLDARNADDNQLRWIARLQIPVELTITGSTRVTAGGLGCLAGGRVVGLTLLGEHITDDLLPGIAKLKQLESLMILQASVSDAGIHHLKGLSALSTLSLGGTQVTENAKLELRRALPKLRGP